MTMPLVYTPLNEIETHHAALRAGFKSRRLTDVAYRKYQILQVGYLVKDNTKRFEEALASDLGRPSLESHFMEIGATLSEVKTTYDGVASWAKPIKPAFSLNFSAMRPVIRQEPKGVVLIISPFNFPIWLCLGPMVGALAAGNAVLLKPSEQAPAVSALITELIPKYLDTDYIRVVNGAVPETTRILELQWDHILYTGGARVAKFVAAAAAKNLTPVTLELGGKSPVIIDADTADLVTATRRILWGKAVNAGQVCVAPDYLLVARKDQEKVVDAFKKTYAEFYPDTPETSIKTPGTFSRLISPAAYTRVANLVRDTKGTIVFGGETDEKTKFVGLTLVKDVTEDDVLMDGEIFGPILPIVPVDDLDAAIAFINARDHPLALYVFSADAEVKAKVFDNTQSGACVANEVVIHPGGDGLPFGGIGPSGNGQHTGKFTFDMFTHQRASMDSPNWVDYILNIRYAPYTPKKTSTLIARFTPKLPARPTGPPAPSNKKWFASGFILALSLAVVAVLTQRKLQTQPDSVRVYFRKWLTGSG